MSPRAHNSFGAVLDAQANAAEVQVAPLREERLLLLLSIFIGVISGLLVVSFRMAIEWLSVLLRGSSRSPTNRA